MIKNKKARLYWGLILASSSLCAFAGDAALVNILHPDEIHTALPAVQEIAPVATQPFEKAALPNLVSNPENIPEPSEIPPDLQNIPDVTVQTDANIQLETLPAITSESLDHYTATEKPVEEYLIFKPSTAKSKNSALHGKASWYGLPFHGRKTANGETYDMYAMTAAHKTLRLGTYVRVTNLNNGRNCVVKVNDRGPYVAGRIIDLSFAAAQKLDIVRHGFAEVALEVLQ